MTMLETMQALLGLQELDEDIFRVRQELKRLPEERARRRATIDVRLTRVAAIDQELLGHRMRVKEVEDITRQHRQRIRKLEGEMNDARDAALVAACQHEVRNLKRDINEAEDEALTYIERIEALDAERGALKQEIDSEEVIFAEYSENLEKETAAAEAKLADLEKRRAERMGTELSADVLSEYEKLLEAREGIALAALEGRICQGCYMEVPANVKVRLSQAAALVQCPSCDRILYLYSMQA
jgi:predicted  nucleic acid-binding Zn-ribbon protein